MYSEMYLSDSNPSPWFQACEENNVQEIQDRLSNGELVDQSNSTGATGLLIAARAGSVEVCEELLRRGANVNHMTMDQTPLMQAAVTNNETLAKLLINHGADVNAQRSSNRTTALFDCKGDGAVAQYLLDNGANVNHTDSAGRTPLIHQTMMSHSDIVDLLLHHGADMDHQDRLGRTAMMEAAEVDRGVVILKKLLERGAKTRLTDFRGKTAKDLADRFNLQQNVDTIKQGEKVQGLTHYTRLSYNAAVPKPTTNAHWSTVEAPSKVINFLKYEDNV